MFVAAVRPALTRAADWAVRSEGSTRSSALIRIGLAAIAWARFGQEMLPMHAPSPGRLALSVAFFAATGAMFFGVVSRASTGCAAAVLLTMTYYYGVARGHDPWTHHHPFLLAYATALCALTPCGQSYSFDRWRAVARATRHQREPPPERGNLWGLRLMALLLSSMYLWSAFAKTNVGFLSGARMEHYAMFFYAGSDYPSIPGFGVAMMLSAWGAVALEYALSVGLLFRRTRRWLLMPGLVLHGAFYVLLPVETFTVTVWLLYLAVVDADAVHRVCDGR